MFLFIYLKIEGNGNAKSVIAMLVAWAATAIPLKIYDRYLTRHVRREINDEKRRLGYPVGWRVHLPWNAKYPGWKKYQHDMITSQRDVATFYEREAP